MSTPISQLGLETEKLNVSPKNYVSRTRVLLKKYKTYVVLLCVVWIVLEMPVDKVRAVLPTWIFSFGQAPILSIIITLMYYMSVKFLEVKIT